MSSGNQVLSQSEIDAMLASQAEENNAPVSTTVAPPKGNTPPAAHPEKCRATESLSSLNKAVTGITERLTALESAPKGGKVSDDALSDINSTINELRESISALSGQIQAINKNITEVGTNLTATPGYQAHKTFTCGSCQTTGLIAIRTKCTECGKEFWWGWYPESK